MTQFFAFTGQPLPATLAEAHQEVRALRQTLARTRRYDDPWTSPHWAVYEDHAIRVLQFSLGFGTPILIVPPQAGHHSYIADFAPGQSLVEAAVASGDRPVYVIEWKGCTHERRDEGIEDLLAQLDTAVCLVGRAPHLVGLCQGGWLAAIFACLVPGRVASLTMAGTPIDTQVGDSALHRVTGIPLAAFAQWVLWGGGRMRGQLMLMGWKAGDPLTHYVSRYAKRDDKTDRFYAWYDTTQDLAGRWYLWAIDSLFQRNLLGMNVLTIGDRPIDLHVLQRLARVNLVVGSQDDITPPEQSLALTDYVDAACHWVDAGHIGVFMSREAIATTWAPLFAALDTPLEIAP